MTRAASFTLTLIIASAASYWSARFAFADYFSQSDSILERKRAAELAPGNSWYWTSLATIEQQNGIDAMPAFRAAAAVSPMNAKAWMDLGLQEEVAGNYAAAEANLLRATQVSREYIPRWAMASYYFRRQDAGHFWPWARTSLEISAGELQAIFRMCWTLNKGEDPESRSVIPDRPVVLDRYLWWLTDERKFQAASKVVDRFIPVAREEHLPTFRYLCDREIDAGEFGQAGYVWNRLVAARLIEKSKLPAPLGIENGRFDSDLWNAGFDWRVAAQEGVSVRPMRPGLRIAFSGNEAEFAMPLSQYVLLEPKRQYRLEYEYESSGIRPGSGLAWRVFSSDGKREYTKDPPGLAADSPVRESEDFVTPPGIKGGRLILTYRRAPGTTRIEGWLQFRQVTLRPVR